MINVLSTNVKIFRNVKDYKFMPKLEESKRAEIENKVAVALKNKLTNCPLETLPAQTLEALKQNGFINMNTKSVFLSQNNDVCVTLFGEEHVTINAKTDGFNKSVFNEAKEIESLLKQKLSLSYNDEYGYLMTNLYHLGSGIEIKCYIDLSSIISLGKIEQVKQNLRKLGYDLYQHSNNVYCLSTICTLGFSYSDVVADFGKMVEKLQEIEIESLKMLDIENHDEILDKAYRSLAILNNSYLMNVEELQNLISNVVAGVNLKIIKIEPEIIKNLYKLTAKNKEFISKAEMIELSTKVKEILKGGKNV